MAGATARVEVQRLTEAHSERTAARNVEAPPRQRLVGAADGRGNDRHARPKRHHSDARLAGDEAALAAERSLREDPDHAALLQHPEAPLHGAWVGPAQADPNGSDAPMEGWMQRARVEDPRHDKEADGARHGHAQHHTVEIVVMIGGEDERPVSGHALESRDLEAEESPQHRRAGAAHQLIQEGKTRGARPGGAQSRGRHDLESARFVAGRHGLACVYSIDPPDRQGARARPGRRQRSLPSRYLATASLWSFRLCENLWCRSSSATK